jgi:alpha-N-arabinofuranosidase
MIELYHLITAGLLMAAATATLASHEGKPEVISNVVKVSALPMHSGRINPMIYGGFIELLDDLVPGMWAEMLNDRSFEGSGDLWTWIYYTGAPNFCDIKWDENSTWTYDTENPFNGSRSVKLSASVGKPATLTQAGLATKKRMTYHFSGHFRTDSKDTKAIVELKVLLPDGEWMVLASKELPVSGTGWQRYTCDMISNGITDRAVFELKVSGKGHLWVDKLSLMPSDNIKGWRKDVIEVIKEQKPGMIRWGGCIVDPGCYKWKAGIGNRDKRVPFQNPTWGRLDSNDVGIDEFLQFCELVGVEPLICLSMSDDPESARDMIEYVNGNLNTEWGKKRAENGHPKPYNVKYWQLGNELGGEEYAAKCVDYCKTIRMIQPDAFIMSSFPSTEVIKAVGQHLNYICPHHYTPDLNSDENNLRSIEKMLKDAQLEGKIKVGVTEWNSTGGDPGLLRGKLQSLWCGLFAGRYLNILHKYSNLVDFACRSNITNSFCSGMIQTNAATLYKTPGYHVMKLYAIHSKPVPLSVTGTPEDVDVSACASDDGKKVTIFAVNMKNEPVEIRLDLSEHSEGFVPISGEVVCDTQDRRQLEVMNHFTAPDRVTTVKLEVSGKSIVLPAYSSSAIECAAK